MNDTELTENSSPKARAVRLKRLRHMLGVTSIGLAELLKYTRQTVSQWENANETGGLSEKGALKIAEAARSKGVLCDPRWLLFGFGELQMLPSSPPEFQHKTENNLLIQRENWIQNSVDKLQSNLKFFKEIESFLLTSQTAVIAEITDSQMEPVYKKGDWVGGHLTTVGDHLIGEICIIENNATAQVRMIRSGRTKGQFNVSYLKKTDDTEADFELKNIAIPTAALITRLWRYKN